MDYYDELGVTRSAADIDVKKACVPPPPPISLLMLLHGSAPFDTRARAGNDNLAFDPTAQKPIFPHFGKLYGIVCVGLD
jgi:hypothetical protein